MMHWKIYYSDGSTFSDQDGHPTDAPSWDVQVIAESNERVGRLLHSRDDYFVFDNGCWRGVDLIGMIDYVANVLGVVKVGRMVDSRVFKKVYQRAMNDPDLPIKSGWDQKERRT